MKKSLMAVVVLALFGVFVSSTLAEENQVSHPEVSQSQLKGAPFLSKRQKRLEARLASQSLSPEKRSKLITKLTKIEGRLAQKRAELLAQYVSDQPVQTLSKTQSKAHKANRKQSRRELKAEYDRLAQLNTQIAAEEAALRQAEDPEAELALHLAPSAFFALQTLPNDPELTNQWAPTFIAGTQPNFWNSSPEDAPKTVVAVIDAGVDFSHPDLAAAKWAPESCVDQNNQPIADGCPNGGWDFVDDDNDPSPTDGIAHGTQVAGLLAASTNNGEGIASVSNNTVQVMALRTCCTANHLLQAADIAAAIDFATYNRADIINLSLGGPVDHVTIKEALQRASAAGITIFAAAGNYGQNLDQTPLYPANYSAEIAQLYTVGAVDENGQLSAFSNYSPTYVNLAAPGENLLTTSLNASYQTVSGTSFGPALAAAVFSRFMADAGFGN